MIRRMSKRSRLAPTRLMPVLSALLTVVLVALLAVRARDATAPSGWPRWLEWYGRPSSSVSILLVLVVLAVTCALFIRSQGGHRTGTPVAIVAGLALVCVVLGMASYWNCHDGAENPFFFTALMWTASLVKGAIGDPQIGSVGCPHPTPVALDVARLAALGVLFITVLGVVSAIFRDRLDRIRVFMAGAVTVIVGMDDDAVSMVRAIASDKRTYGTPIILTASPDRPCVQNSRKLGVRVVTVDFDREGTWTSLSLWDKLRRLYLLSSDATMNLVRLDLIKKRIDLDSRSTQGRQPHVPLVVRIDDPWQAESWRAQQMGAEDRWAPDAVGKYEVTATRLLDRIIAGDKVSRIIVCGTSQLTLALCADLAQRWLEYEFCPTAAEPPTITLVAENAEEYRNDHEYHRGQLGLSSDHLVVEAIPHRPTTPFVKSLLNDEPGAVPRKSAIIVVDADPIAGSSVDSSTASRLAALLPAVPIYAWDPNAEAWDPTAQRTVEETGEELFLVGRLRTFRLTMDLPEGQAQDAWERAARLIHTEYLAAEAGKAAKAAEAARPAKPPEPSESAKPWDELSPFYKGSNHRAVLNVLWIVKTEGGHTWDTWGTATETVTPDGFAGFPPIAQLKVLGFSEAAAKRMAEKEYASWYDYLDRDGWQWGPVKSDKDKTNPRMVQWDPKCKDEENQPLQDSLGTLADTLIALRRLGYRSRPEWRRYRRGGVVTARQRDEAWTWISPGNATMRAEPGDWEVSDGSGASWSVNKERFVETYEQIDDTQWRRTGTVLARLAVEGETVESLEGPQQAVADDWVVKGERGEQWLVPNEDFVKNYEGPLTSDGPTGESS
jgi:hypothetical protein